MRRLRDYQAVTVTPRPRTTPPVPAVVAAVAGTIAWLLPRNDRLPEGLPLPGAAELEFEHQGQVVLLSGTLDADDAGWLTFSTAAAGQLAEQRRAPRLAIHVDVRLTGPTQWGHTQTVDLSSGGALLAGQHGAAGETLRLELTLPGAGGTIEAGARVVRSSAETTAIVFGALADEDRETLGALVYSVRRELARRFVQRKLVR
jgi:hypothetical protein